MGLTIVPLDHDVGGVLLRTLRAGGLVGLLVTASIPGNGVEVEFFGERTSLPGGPATLALRKGAAILPTAVYSEPNKGTPRSSCRRFQLTGRDRFARTCNESLNWWLGTSKCSYTPCPEQWYLFQPNWPSDSEALADKGE